MRYFFGLIVIVLLLSASSIRCQESSPAKIRLDFEGNRVFNKEELTGVADRCLRTRNSFDSEDLEYCWRKVKQFLAGKGYLTSKLSSPMLRETQNGLFLTVSIDEGPLYRLGSVQIKGSKLFSPTQILATLNLKTGDTANADSISEWLYERVAKAYHDRGYLRYTAELEPEFHAEAGAPAGIVDLSVTIDEGGVFTIRSIKFDGNGNTSQDALLGEMLMRTGDVFNKELLYESLKRINETGNFEMIDLDKDVDYKADDNGTRLDLTIRLTKKRIRMLTPLSDNSSFALKT